MAVTTNQKVTLCFNDMDGEAFNVSISKVKDLTDETGKTLVGAAMDSMIYNQPYTTSLASKKGAYQTVTTKTDIEMTD